MCVGWWRVRVSFFVFGGVCVCDECRHGRARAGTVMHDHATRKDNTIGLWVGDMLGPDFLVYTNTLNLSGTCQE